MRNATRQLAAWVALCALAPAAQAVDIVMLLPLKEVLELPEAKGRLDGSVRFHLAGQPALQVLQMRGEEIANKKAVLQDKNSRISCERAALASLLILQQGAKREGANAVVDIVSFYKQNTVANAAAIECHVGTFSAFVTLKGSYASVAP
jgi:FtsZ-binding cell division protein ZapB